MDSDCPSVFMLYGASNPSQSKHGIGQEFLMTVLKWCSLNITDIHENFDLNPQNMQKINQNSHLSFNTSQLGTELAGLIVSASSYFVYFYYK